MTPTWSSALTKHHIVRITDDTWVSPHDVVGLQAHFDGTRILLRHNHALQVDLSVADVIEQMRRGFREAAST